MITVYSGTLGSGKSYHALHTILEELRRGHNVVADFPLDLGGLRGLRGTFVYRPTITVSWLIKWADAHHDYTSHDECQTLVVIDEVYNYFDPRDYTRPDRAIWVNFLKISRHYCLGFLMVCQNAKTDLDKKILKTVEYDVVHINAMRLQWGFALICLLTGTWFVCNRWRCSQGVARTKIDSRWVHLNKRKARRYSSHHIYDDSVFLRELERYERLYGKEDDEDGEPEQQPGDGEQLDGGEQSEPGGGEQCAGGGAA